MFYLYLNNNPRIIINNLNDGIVRAISIGEDSGLSHPS
jgi:hypothetical protein